MAKGDGLAWLFGRADRRECVVVTPRGVELPLGQTKGTEWDVYLLNLTLAQIDSLPETPDRDGWSRRARRG